MKIGFGKLSLETNKSIMSYLFSAFVEWILMMMLFLNSIFIYLIYRFVHRFQLYKPCLCCSTLFVPSTDLLCHHHAASTKYGYAADDDKANVSSVDDKGILEGTRPDQQKQLFYDNYTDPLFRDFSSLDKSTKFIRDLYSNEKVVELTFIEDQETLDKEFVSGEGGLNWEYALSHAQPLIDESNQENMVTVIKHKMVNDDESYSIAYTAEGDLVMDLRRNLAYTKSNLTAFDTLDDVLQIKPSPEQQTVHYENNENIKGYIELDAVVEVTENSSAIATQSCMLNETTGHDYEEADEVARSVSVSPPTQLEDIVCEQADEVARSVSVSPPTQLEDIVCEQADDTSTSTNQQNGEVVPDALLSESPSPHTDEEPSRKQLGSYQDQSPASSCPLSVEDNSHSSKNDSRGSDQVEESIGITELNSGDAIVKQLTVSLDLINNEAEKLPDTPSSFDGAHNLYRSWLLLEKREVSLDETPNGSVAGDFECGEGILTIDKLKTALKVERKALHALYAELEEERNASAVAASQTMAMINRLQEEKAAVQMEALQYQRMMDGQSEYDQEALQLLNDLMVKKDRENQELEKELQVYRTNVIDYETKVRLLMLSSKEENLRCKNSSVSCSNAEDSDGVSIDLKVDMKNINGFECIEGNRHNKTPFDDIVHMEDTLSQFEEERLSILEQLKVLEENLFTLDDRDDGFPLNHDSSFFINGNKNRSNNDIKGNENKDRRIKGANAKLLLPLFDAAVNGDENGELSRNENGHDFISYPHSSSSTSEPENKIISIEEEVDHVYQRLQTLEADSEFLRHCFNSLKGGDKGLELLQEILQHLRNLRNIELESGK